MACIFGVAKLLALAKPLGGIRPLQLVRHLIKWLTRLYIYSFMTYSPNFYHHANKPQPSC